MALHPVLEMYFELSSEQLRYVKRGEKSCGLLFPHFNTSRHTGALLVPKMSTVANRICEYYDEDELSVYEGVTVYYDTLTDVRCLTRIGKDPRLKVARRIRERCAYIILDPFYMKSHLCSLLASF